MANYKYPKLTVLVLAFIFAYLLFAGRQLHGLRDFLLSTGIFGIFIAGMLYSYGFTGPISTAVFLVMAKSQNFLIAGIVGGLGSVCADMLLFKLLRHSVMDEMKLLGQEPVISHLKDFLSRVTHVRIKSYVLPLIGAFIIASPLPDEIGVSLIAAYTKVSPELFAVISFALNTIGIMTILYVGIII